MLSNEALELFGRPLTAYMFAVKPSELSDVLARPDPQQENLANTLEQLAQDVLTSTEGIPQESRVSIALEKFVGIAGMGTDAGVLPLASRFHEHAGGRLPVTESGDPVLDALAGIGVAALPALIAGEGREANGLPMVLVSPVMNLHPGLNEALQLLRDDSELGLLFVDDSEDLEQVRGFVMYGDGTGGAVQLQMLPHSLIAGAYGRSGPDADALVGELAGELAALRKLATSGTADLRYLVGLIGVALPDDQSVELSCGVLRERQGGELQQPSFLRGGFPPDPPLPTTVLEIDLEVLAKIGTTVQPDGHDPMSGISDESRRVHDEIESRTRRVALAILLALRSHDPPVTVVPRLRTATRPGMAFSSMAGLGPLLGRVGHGEPVQLSADDLAAIARWDTLLDASWHSSIEIAANRTLRSLRERLDPLDGLIDAVIAWESLFSPGEGELSFRISAAIAWLLEPTDETSRLGLFKEVRDLYRRRNEVVHGRDLSVQEAEPLHARAAEISVAILAALFEDRPDLVPRKDNRAQLLILHAPPEGD